MVQALALGFFLLFVVLLFGRLFATTSPAMILRGLKWGGIAVAALTVVGVVVTGRLPLLLAGLAALVPWLIRAMHLHSTIRYFRSTFAGPGAGWTNAGSVGGGQTSNVETRWLRMALDHDSGEIDGEILEGEFKGLHLLQLTPDELERLWRACRADPQSAQVLDAWLDRYHPGLRTGSGGGGATGAASASAGTMTREEACSVLGVDPGATADEIKAAHRRLMRTCHPDHGGSDWLASRINQAKDLLLHR